MTDTLGLTTGDEPAGDGAPAGASTSDATAARTRVLVEVAVDAPAGPGPRTFTYLVPAALGDLEPGEPVLVPFGKGGRQAIGVVTGPAGRAGRAASCGTSRRASAATGRSCRRSPSPSPACSPTATSRRWPWSSGRCSRRACSSASS